MAEQKTVYKLIPQLGKLRYEVLFGDVWEQPNCRSVIAAWQPWPC